MEDLPAIAGGQPIRTSNNPILFGAPVIGQSEIQAIAGCVERRWIGSGSKVTEFEQAFAAYKGAPHAIAVSSCTAALHLALLALGIGEGDEVITPSLTYCAALHNIKHVGATPVLIDNDPLTLNLDHSCLEDVITSRTKAIIVVHFAGRCCDMNPILEIARKKGIYIIEDCAHAIESKYHGQPAGLIGDVGCFSFYPTKNMTTIEGGMLLTSSSKIANKVKVLSQQGLSDGAWERYSNTGHQHYEIVEAGFKYNMTDIQAAIGLVQLKKVPSFHNHRATLWAHYEKQLEQLPCIRPAPVSTEGSNIHALHLYTIQIEVENLPFNRGDVIKALTAENISTGIHYTPLHESKFYQKLYDWKHLHLPNAEYAGTRLLSLPLAADLLENDIDDVCRALYRIFSYFKNYKN